MKALVVESLSPDLSGVSFKTAEKPIAAAGEVTVRVRAASLNYPDLLMTRGTYQFKPDPPFVSGLEMAGEVVDAPEGFDFNIGDRVRGGAKTGAFAEYIALPPRALREMPTGFNFGQAAAFGAAYTTAYVSLCELGRLEKGQTVLVHGASGGVGLAACDLAKALGATVIAATNRAEKRGDLLAASKADHIIANTGRFREAVETVTGGRLCDLVIDPVGGEVFHESTRCVTFGGKLLVVGFVSGRIPEIAVNIPLIKGFSIVGVRAGEYSRRFPGRAENMARTLDNLAEAEKIAPHIDRTLPIARWREGFEAMAAGELTGKVVFTF